MPAKVSWQGLDKLDKNLALIGALPKTKEAKKVFINAAVPVWKYARFFAPFDKTRKKGTHLRDAILISEGPLMFTDVLVTVRYRRPGAPHAHLLEFGTVRSAARPFMRPAAATAASEVKAILHKQILELIKKTPK